MMNFICKCKVILAIAAPFCCFCGEIPLEWNINNKANVPYELEIDRRKIADIAGIAVDHTYKVTATANGKKTDLQTVLLPGQENNKVTLRFTVPEGITTIEDSAFSGCTSLESISISNLIPFFRWLIIF